MQGTIYWYWRASYYSTMQDSVTCMQVYTKYGMMHDAMHQHMHIMRDVDLGGSERPALHYWYWCRKNETCSERLNLQLVALNFLFCTQNCKTIVNRYHDVVSFCSYGNSLVR